MATRFSLGNLIRIAPLQLGDLPSHPALAKLKDTSNNGGDVKDDSYDSNFSSQVQKPVSVGDYDRSQRPAILPFIKAALDEATIFVDEIMPNTFRPGGEKSSAPAAAKVKLLKREIGGHELSRVPWTTSEISRKPPKAVANSGEAWFARRSRHANRSDQGTAEFPEFDHGLRVNHSEHEREYTPDVFDSYRVLDWDLETVRDDVVIDNYSEIRMSIYEMCHKLPFPLLPRVFPVLVITAKTGQHSFAVVQIPVNIESLPEAFYSNGRNRREGDSALKRKTPILGVYTSIERCRMLPDMNIEWIMATASDAKGWLPMWAQKMGVPAAVVKDVGLLIKWVSEQRSSLSDYEPATGSQPGRGP